MRSEELQALAIYTVEDSLADVKTAILDPETDLRELFEDYELAHLMDARDSMDSIIQAAKRVKAAVDAEIVDKLDGGSVRFGDRFLRAGSVITRRFRNPTDAFSTIVRKGLIECGLSVETVAAAFSISPRITGIRALEEAAGERFSDLVETIEGDPMLKAIPVTKAPKYAQAMENGEVRR